MQNVQEYPVASSVRLLGGPSLDKEPVDAKKLVATSTSNSNVSSHAAAAPEVRVPRVTTDRGSRDVPSCHTSGTGDKPLQASVIADKYYLLDQVEGSSLYRCVDIKTRDELVCKVSKI